MKLYELIPPDHIKLNIEAGKPTKVIEELVDVLTDAGALSDRELVLQNVLDREAQVGTGIGYGVAIPHAEPGPYQRPIVAVGRLIKPVNFHAPDGVKATLVFLLLTPEETPALHVRLLARICRLTRSKALRDRLAAAKTPEEAAAVIESTEMDYPELTP